MGILWKNMLKGAVRRVWAAPFAFLHGDFSGL